MGRQHQGMDTPGVRRVPEGSGEQGEVEKTGCKIICGAPTTLVVKGLMMMMVMKRQTLSARGDMVDELTTDDVSKPRFLAGVGAEEECSWVEEESDWAGEI